MAIYEPLRDSFRELNRLLVDKQQFDAQQKLNQSNQQLKNKMLEVTVADKEFAKNIAVAGLDIRRSGQKIQKGLADQQILGLQQRLKIGELQAKKNQALLKPREYSLNYILNNDPRLLSNLDLKKDIESLFTEEDPNASWDPASGGMTVKGKRHKLSDYEMAQRIVPAVMAMKESYTDAPSDAMGELEEIELKLKGIKGRRAGILDEESAQYAGNLGLANLSSLKDARFIGKKADLDREENALKAKYIELEQFISPMGRMDYWNDKRDYFHRMANYFETMGESGAATNLRVRAGQAATTANTWLTAQTKGSTAAGTLQMKPIFKGRKFVRTGTWSTKGGWATPLREGETPVKPAVDTKDYVTIGRKSIADTVIRNRLILPGLPGQAKVAKLAERIYTDMALTNPPTNSAQAYKMAEQAEVYIKDAHNMFFQSMQQAMQTKKDRGKKEQQKLLGFILKSARERLGYMPKGTYSETVELLGEED